MSINTPIKQWVQEIKIEINQVLAMYRKVIAHRCKLACICGQLQNFNKTVQARIKPDQIASPKDHIKIQRLILLLKELSDLFTSLSEKNYIETILSNDMDYVVEFLRKFRKSFNKLALELNFADKDPLPINTLQEAVDDKADINEISDMLKSNNEDGEIPSKYRSIYMSRIAELATRIRMYMDDDESQQEPGDKVRILTQTEVEDNLKWLDKKWIYKQNDFQLKKIIGQGGFADVYWSYQVTSTGFNKVVAVKKLKATHFTQYSFELFSREIKIFTQMEHPSILSLTGISLSYPYYIVTEFMEGGCLYDRLHSREPLRDPTKLTIIAMGVAYALRYMHRRKLIHRDVKSLNVLLDENDFPKLCDFGMSRVLPEGNELMSGGIGTSQWMAPEVMKSERYTEKADVYSYGILLWELLTGEIPFKKMSDVQVTLAVVSQNARPMMPQNCSPRLSKLIKICWDQDPSKRPDFETICKMFESREMDFPGTKDEDVAAYVNLLKESTSVSTSFDPNVASESAVSEIITELTTDGDGAFYALLKIQKVLSKKNWFELFMKANLPSALAKTIKECPDVKAANEAINVLTEALKDADFFNEFVVDGNENYVLDVISKFGSTSMSKAIECMTILLKKKPTKLSQETITKIAPFLASSDLNLRKEAADLLIYVADNSLFDDDASLNPVIHNVLMNAIPETTNALLVTILNLLTRLTKFSSPLEVIRSSYDGPKRILELTVHQDDEVALDSLILMRIIIEGLFPAPLEIIQSFIKYFPALVHRTNKLIEQSLIALSILMRSQYAYKQLSASQPAIDALKDCLENDDERVLVFSLKVLVMLLKNQTSSFAFIKLIECIIKRVDHESLPVRKLSLCAISIAIRDDSILNSTLNDEKFSAYIKASLEGDLAIDSLRILGMIAQTYEGCAFIEKEGITDIVVEKIKADENTDEKTFAFAVLAAFSLQYPFSIPAINAIPSFFEAIEQKVGGEYPLIFVANMAVNPEAAIQIMPKLNILTKIFTEEEGVVSLRALTAIQRALSAPEASSLILDVLPSIIPIIASSLDGKNESEVLSMLLSLSSIAGVKAELLKTEIPNILMQKMKLISINNPIRPALMTVISRVIR